MRYYRKIQVLYNNNIYIIYIHTCIYTQYIDKYSCCIIKDQRTEWEKK